MVGSLALALYVSGFAFSFTYNRDKVHLEIYLERQSGRICNLNNSSTVRICTYLLYLNKASPIGTEVYQGPKKMGALCGE